MPEQSNTTGGALPGLRFLEAGHIIAGPFCGNLFAGHGPEAALEAAV